MGLVSCKRTVDHCNWDLSDRLSADFNVYSSVCCRIYSSVPVFPVAGVCFRSEKYEDDELGKCSFNKRRWYYFSLLLIFNPIFTGISLVTLTGVSFIFMGIASIMLALDLRKVKKIPGKVSQELRDRIKSIQDEIDDLKK